jgi:hypothetical protein
VSTHIYVYIIFSYENPFTSRVTFGYGLRKEFCKSKKKEAAGGGGLLLKVVESEIQNKNLTLSLAFFVWYTYINTHTEEYRGGGGEAGRETHTHNTHSLAHTHIKNTYTGKNPTKVKKPP